MLEQNVPLRHLLLEPEQHHPNSKKKHDCKKKQAEQQEQLKQQPRLREYPSCNKRKIDPLSYTLRNLKPRSNYIRSIESNSSSAGGTTAATATATPHSKSDIVHYIMASDTENENDADSNRDDCSENSDMSISPSSSTTSLNIASVQECDEEHDESDCTDSHMHETARTSAQSQSQLDELNESFDTAIGEFWQTADEYDTTNENDGYEDDYNEHQHGYGYDDDDGHDYGYTYDAQLDSRSSSSSDFTDDDDDNYDGHNIDYGDDDDDHDDDDSFGPLDGRNEYQLGIDRHYAYQNQFGDYLSRDIRTRRTNLTDRSNNRPGPINIPPLQPQLHAHTRTQQLQLQLQSLPQSPSSDSTIDSIDDYPYDDHEDDHEDDHDDDDDPDDHSNSSNRLLRSLPQALKLRVRVAPSSPIPKFINQKSRQAKMALETRIQRYNANRLERKAARIARREERKFRQKYQSRINHTINVLQSRIRRYNAYRLERKAARIARRKERHLRLKEKYKSRIIVIPSHHPAKITWDTLTILLTFVSAYFGHIYIRDRSTYEWDWFVLFSNVWFFVDLLLNFFTEHRASDGTVMRSGREVWGRYLTTWFAIDALSLLPWERMFLRPIIQKQKRRNFVVKWFFRSKAVVKVMRILKGSHIKAFGRVANNTKNFGVGSKKLLHLMIKYIPKYVLFYRNMKGVLVLKTLRQIHFAKKIFRGLASKDEKENDDAEIEYDETLSIDSSDDEMTDGEEAYLDELFQEYENMYDGDMSDFTSQTGETSYESCIDDDGEDENADDDDDEDQSDIDHDYNIHFGNLLLPNISTSPMSMPATARARCGELNLGASQTESVHSPERSDDNILGTE